MRRDHFDAFSDFQARIVRLYDQRDERIVAVLGVATEDSVEISDARVGDPGLRAIDDITIRIFLRRGLHGSEIGTGIGFGDGKCGNTLSRGNSWKIFLLQLFSSELRDWSRAKTLQGKSKL